MDRIDEIFTCLRYGPLLFFSIPLGLMKLSEEDKMEKQIRKEKLEKEKLIIRTRFEIMDL